MKVCPRMIKEEVQIKGVFMTASAVPASLSVNGLVAIPLLTYMYHSGLWGSCLCIAQFISSCIRRLSAAMLRANPLTSKILSILFRIRLFQSSSQPTTPCSSTAQYSFSTCSHQFTGTAANSEGATGRARQCGCATLCTCLRPRSCWV